MSFLTVDRQAPPTANTEKNDEDPEKEDDLEVDNSVSVLRKIATLYAEQLMSDITLEVGGVQYPAHRLILCASSQVFQVMLMNRDWTEWRERHIVLQEAPPAAQVFPHFLKYFYTGQIKISLESVLPVLSLADKYNVKDLSCLCLCYMRRHIAEAARRSHLVCWLQYSAACTHTHLARACENFLKWNMSVCAREQLASLEPDALLTLLQHSDLVLTNEMELYDFAVWWFERQRDRLAGSSLAPEERDAHLHSLVTAVFSHIRFPMMCPQQLAALLLSPLTQQYKELFMERMALAMSYHSGQTERVRAAAGAWWGRQQFTPRLYTEDRWGCELNIDQYHSLQCYHTRTFIFSTRHHIADHPDQDRQLEWTLDLYPKGVWFRKSLLIMWTGTYDVPEVVLRTVRISITCQNPPAPRGPEGGDGGDVEPDIRVKVGLLIWGETAGGAGSVAGGTGGTGGGTEGPGGGTGGGTGGAPHIVSVLERVHRFSHSNRVLNIDGALDFDELNTPLFTPRGHSSAGAGGAAAGGGTAAAANSTAPHTTTHSECGAGCCGSVPQPHSHLLGPDRDQLKIQVVIMPLTEFCYLGPPEQP